MVKHVKNVITFLQNVPPECFFHHQIIGPIKILVIRVLFLYKKPSEGPSTKPFLIKSLSHSKIWLTK